MTTKIDILQQLKSRGNPLIEGDRVTFYWQGDSPPLLLDELHGWEEGYGQRLKRVPARLARGAQPPLWSTSFTLPQDAYLEYSFYDPYNRDHLADPFNPRTCNNGMGGRNHFFYMPGAAPTPLAVRRNRVKHGTIMRRMVDTWLLVDDGQREVHFYQPPVEQPAPLLVVYDGTDYLQRGRLATIVDNLIAEGRIRPLAMAFLQNGGRRRSVEYACSDATIAWLDRIILPLARRHLNLLDVKSAPGAFAVLGASFGALMAVYTGLRMPEIFGKVISQSGSFESDGRDFAAVDLVRYGHAREQLDIWMDAGRLDTLLEENRRMHSILAQQRYRVQYHEHGGGHSYTAWRDNLPLGLEALFSP